MKPRLARLLAIAEKSPRLVVGLATGPSADGVDAALVEIRGAAATAQVTLLAHATLPYPAGVKSRLVALFDPATARIDEIAALDVLLGELYAEAAGLLVARAGYATEDLDLVGVAGQRIWHDPEPVVAELEPPWSPELVITRSSLVIGSPAVVAERTGSPTLGGFSARDLAAGGHGTPLGSYADWVLFRHPGIGRCVQTLGGIATVTWIPPDADRSQVLAFVTGPGTIVVDQLVAAATGGDLDHDRDGALAAAGRVDDRLLAALLDDPFFAVPPPRTAGRERFGRAYVESVLARGAALPLPDLVATATAFSAHAIADAYRRFVMPLGPIDEVFLSGGGALNPVLTTMLRRLLPGSRVADYAERGIDPRARDAAAVAIVAHDSALGHETNLTGATGARPTVLGAISL